MISMICSNCGTVYDVFYEGEQVWQVKNPDFSLVIDQAGNVRPQDFAHSNQTQASTFPLCVKVECVISKTQGILREEIHAFDNPLFKKVYQK